MNIAEARKAVKYLQPARPYWFYRLYVGIFAVVWNVVGLTSLARDQFSIWMLLLFPFMFPAISWFFSLGAFKFPYSNFGPLPRTPWPAGRPVAHARSGGKVGWCHASGPLIAWAVFDDGIGFRIVGSGAGFIPFSATKHVKSRLLGGCAVHHASEEVRSPLVIPSRKICKAIRGVASIETLN